MTARALIFLLLAGCSAAAPDIVHVSSRPLTPPFGPYLRVQAEVEVSSDRFSGTFQAILVARTGVDPRVRLQLLPEVGGKVFDLVAGRERIAGWFPHSGEKVDVSFPGDAKPHPILLFGITLLECFADARSRILSFDGSRYSLRPLIPGVEVFAGERLAFFPEGPGILLTLNFRWKSASWTWRSHPESVSASGFSLQVKARKDEVLDRVDESVFRLELPVDSR